MRLTHSNTTINIEWVIMRNIFRNFYRSLICKIVTRSNNKIFNSRRCTVINGCGNLIGEKNPNQAKFASFSAIYLCSFAALINSIIILLFGSFIVGLYTTEIPVKELAIALTLFAAIFQLPDGVQMGALGSLRGYKDTFAPMVLLFISFWIFAMPIGYFLTNYGFSDPLEAQGMWYGMIIGLSIFSILVISRLRWIIKKTLKFKISAADSSALPPISPTITIASV